MMLDIFGYYLTQNGVHFCMCVYRITYVCLAAAPLMHQFQRQTKILETVTVEPNILTYLLCGDVMYQKPFQCQARDFTDNDPTCSTLRKL